MLGTRKEATVSGKLVTAALVLAMAAGLCQAAEQRDRVYLVSVEGTFYVGELVAVDEAKVQLSSGDGKTVEIDRDKVALINFHPDWIGIRAYGARDGVYYDFGAGFAVPLPEEGWVAAYDSEGHLFLTSQDGKLVLGFYTYLTKHASLDDFLAAHATWRQANGMPQGSYQGGTEATVGGRPARAFRYQAQLQGTPARAMDIKTTGPQGQGLVVAFMGSGVGEEEFDAACREAMALIDGIRFFMPGW